jgi:hypothetical protein
LKFEELMRLPVEIIKETTGLDDAAIEKLQQATFSAKRQGRLRPCPAYLKPSLLRSLLRLQPLQVHHLPRQQKG